MNKNWVALSLLNAGISVSAADNEPWRLAKTLNLPDWLDLRGTHRTRYETLDGQFRAGRAGGDQVLAFRTTLRAEAKFEPFGLVAEIQDSRQELTDSGTPVDTSTVNALELLQAYGWIQLDGLFAEGSKSEVRLGRQTVDLGSRRLVARNSFRNTANSFNGVHWQWEEKDRPTVRAFYLLPLDRQPADAPSLLENEIELDEESLDQQLWGLHTLWSGLPFGANGEAYLLGLHEHDSSTRATANRELYTPGLRAVRAATKGNWDFDFESILQLGTSRSSTAVTDTRDLDHFAHLHHAELGYTFDQVWSPRGAFIFDYASGDDDPNDRENNRFDALYSSRRFEYGPTGIYGTFARSNIQSPGYSLSAKPRSDLALEVKHRFYWLASDTDAWIAAGVRDPSGASGSYVGHQIETSARWDVLPGSLRLEGGGAHLFAGSFVDRAPNANRGDSTYGYFSLEFRF